MSPAPAPRRGRPPREAATIVETALRLVDKAGVQAFSLRTLADELGSGTATLYRHFASKDELMVDVVDRVLGEIHFSGLDTPASWQQALTSGAEALYHALRRHPNTLPLLITQVPVGPNALSAREHALALLVAHGFPTALAARAFTAVGHYVIGFAIQKQGPGAADAADGTQLHAFYRTLDPAAFPVTTAAASALTSVHSDEEFRFGLDLLIVGLERLNAQDDTQT
jgi:AcrR family transcriptional regulator